VKGKYVTFLFDPVGGRELPGTLHRQPDPLQPEGPGQWKVIRDAGSVELIAQVDGATTEIGKARWRDGSLEDLQAIAPHVVTDAQWRQVELALREHVKDPPKPAPAPRAYEHGLADVVATAVAEAEPPASTLRTYITFHLDLAAERTNRAMPGTVAYKPDDRPLPNDFVWKVVCDTTGGVVVSRKAGRKSRVVGTAHWAVPKREPASLGKLAHRRERRPGTPNENQWGWVEAALMAELAKPAAIAASVPIPDAPADANQLLEQLQANADDVRRRNRDAVATRRMVSWLLGSVLLVGAIVVTVLVTCRRQYRATAPIDAAPASPEQRIAAAPTFGDALALAMPAMTETDAPLSPAAIQLAHYKKLRWVDVSGAHATSHAQAVASPAAARGKLMCTAGDISDIARREVGGRWVYVGHLRSDDGERFAFAAVGTAGDLGNRMPARLCGAVVGSRGSTVALFGLFDLPENRMPVVEQ
jgi:transposase